MKLNNLLLEIEVSKYQIFCDLDQVLSDFDSRYQHFTGLSPEEMDKELTTQYGKKIAQQKFWEKVNPVGPQFWSEMDKMSDANELWNFIKEYNPKFLSSPSRSKTSLEGKKIWCNKNYPGTELILRQANQKQEFAGPKNILIDDRKDNCQQWRDRGGIAIDHTSAQDTIKQLEQLGFKNQELQEIEIKPQKRIEFDNGRVYLKGFKGNLNGFINDDPRLIISFPKYSNRVFDIMDYLDKFRIKYEEQKTRFGIYIKINPEDYDEIQSLNEIEIKPELVPILGEYYWIYIYDVNDRPNRNWLKCKINYIENNEIGTDLGTFTQDQWDYFYKNKRLKKFNINNKPKYIPNIINEIEIDTSGLIPNQWYQRIYDDNSIEYLKYIGKSIEHPDCYTFRYVNKWPDHKVEELDWDMGNVSYWLKSKRLKRVNLKENV